MPISFGDVLKLMNAFRDLDQQANARLPRLITSHEFVIAGILRRLRIARDFECYRVGRRGA